MIHRAARALARRVPYLRRIEDGTRAMRMHIEALERESAVLRTELSALRGAVQPQALPAVQFIDEGWCDQAGVYLRGWVHAGPHPVQAITAVSGEHRATVTPSGTRPDVTRHYPDLPPHGAAAFELYLPCPPFAPVVLELATDAGPASVAVALQPLRDQPLRDATGAVEQFMAAMMERRGTVLELGARIVGSMTEGWRPRLSPACTYLANDIHPGPGIDLVGDVHALTRHVQPGSLDGVFSVAVLEHLAAPWLASLEINRALRPGGETLHVTHQTWPVHETPNDFFRMSDEALKSLFGPASGFEVIESGMAYPVSIVPPPHMRNAAWLHVPIGRGFGQSYIRARKVREADRAPSPWDSDLAGISRAYPMPPQA